MARADDLLVAISSSGQSPNIVNAVTSAKNFGCHILTLSGFSPQNSLRFKGDLNVWLDSNNYGIVETGHLFFLHHLMEALSHEKADDVTRNRIAG
jgi:D-sedoheptulose 7-phosphate isomerase